MWKVKKDDIFSLSSGKYIMLDDYLYEQERYIFVNKLDENDEPTNNFLVFKCTNEGLIEEKNKEKLKPLLEYFSEQANKKLELIAETYKTRREE